MVPPRRRPPARLARLALAGAAAALGLAQAGCKGIDPRTTFVHEVDVLDHDLDRAWSPSRPGNPWAFDLVVEGYEGGARTALDAGIAAVTSHPGLRPAAVTLHGADAPPRRREPAPPGRTVVRLACDVTGDGPWTNALVAFPGMFAFLPVWRGYAWEVAVVAEAWVERDGLVVASERTAQRLAVRERNATRSALFHMWPSTGFFGTQFVLGLVLGPTMVRWSDETTPVVVEATRELLGRTLANLVHRALARDPPPEAPAPGGAAPSQDDPAGDSPPGPEGAGAPVGLSPGGTAR